MYNFAFLSKILFELYSIINKDEKELNLPEVYVKFLWIFDFK